MTHQNPMQLATTALNMGRNSTGMDSLVFNKMAVVCMGVTAVAAVAQVTIPVFRELLTALNRKHEKDECRGRGR